MNKINSYLGFAKKSRNIVFGEDKVLSSKPKLVVVSSKTSQNFCGKLKKMTCPIIVLEQTLYESLGEKSLVFGILDSSLANAIENELKIIGGKYFDNKQ